MKVFFEKIRRQWNLRPEPVFDPAHWNALEQMLQEPHQKRRRILPWLVIIGTSIAVGFLSGQYYGERSITHKNRVASIDTIQIVVEKIIFKTDTFFLYPSNRLPIGRLRQPSQLASLKTSDEHSFFKNAYFPNTPIDSTVQSSFPSSSNHNASDLTLLPLTNLLPIEYSPPVLAKTGSVPKIDTKSTRKILSRFRPHHYALCLSGGYVRPPGNEDDIDGGYTYGISLEAGWKNWRLRTDINNYFLNLNANSMTAGGLIPIVIPPDNNLKFINAEARLNFRRYAASLSRRIILKNDNWSPCIGIGAEIDHAFPYDLLYDFENEGLNVSWKFEREVLPESVFKKILMLDLSLERRLTPSWHIGFRSLGFVPFHFNTIQAPYLSHFQLEMKYLLYHSKNY